MKRRRREDKLIMGLKSRAESNKEKKRKIE